MCHTPQYLISQEAWLVDKSYIMVACWKFWGAVTVGAATAGIVLTGVYYYSFRRGFITAGRSQRRGKRDDLIKSAEAKYLIEHNVEDPVLKRLREYTLTLTHGGMATPVEEGKLLTVLCRAIGACKVIDIGVFTGCSAYAMALGLPADGKVIACDVNLEDAMRGQPYWEEGGVASKIDLRIKPAAETLQELVDNGEDGSYDLVFIDADKESYPVYYKYAIELLRTGGLVVVDNALGYGAPRYVYNADNKDAGVEMIRSLNRTMKEDSRIDYVLLNISSGVGIGYKK